MLLTNHDAIRAINEDRPVPRFIMHEGVRVARLQWHSTDAWRGYWDAVPTKSAGWELVQGASDWVTGDWGDAGSHAASRVEARLEIMAADFDEEGKDMLVVFSPTSNVFSTGYDILIHDKAETLVEAAYRQATQG